MIDDQEFTQRQSVRYTTYAIQKYVEAHLAIRVKVELSMNLIIAGRKRRSDRVKSSDEVINKVWESIRSGLTMVLMALLQLMQIKTPLTDADSFRTLACTAMVGLARSSTAT